MQKLSFLFVFLFSVIRMQAQVPTGPSIAWQRCYGGSQDDFFYDAKKTSDGGIITTLQNVSTDGDLAGKSIGAGWVIKYDDSLNEQWQEFFSTATCGYGFQKVYEINSNNLVFSGGGEGTGCNDPKGENDFSLVKTDSAGNIIWSKLYGSSGSEDFESMLPAQDGGFLISGRSNTAGGDIPFIYGSGFGDDAIIIKTDSVGEILWVKVLGGSGDDGPLGDIVEIERGYYVINIGAKSNDYDLEGSGIDGDKRWIVKLDSLGNIADENFISGVDDLYTYTGPAIINYKNGILVVGQGNSDSELYPTSPDHDSDEGAVAIFDSDLEFSYFKQWGGSNFDGFIKVIQDELTGNFYFLGASSSLDYDLPDNYNKGDALDYWLFATDSNFNTL